MLSTDFNQEMGALLRSLENKVRTEPYLTAGVRKEDVLSDIERALVGLVALYLKAKDEL